MSQRQRSTPPFFCTLRSKYAIPQRLNAIQGYIQKYIIKTPFATNFTRKNTHRSTALRGNHASSNRKLWRFSNGCFCYCGINASSRHPPHLANNLHDYSQLAPFLVLQLSGLIWLTKEDKNTIQWFWLHWWRPKKWTFMNNPANTVA